MVGDRSVALLEQAFHRILVELVRDDIRAMLPRGSSASASAEAVVQFAAGALFGLLMWWLEARTRPDVEEVDALFRRLVLPAMAAARQPSNR